VWRTLYLLLLLPQWSIAAGVELSYGLESFYWEEFDGDGSSLLDESGFRHRLTLSLERPVAPAWLSDIEGHLTLGQVAYDGQDSVGDPVSTDTDYRGYGVEAGFSYFPEGLPLPQATGSGVRFSLGVDAWERRLLGAGGYDERYLVAYGRLAGLYRVSAWRVAGGVKLPFAAFETVDLAEYGFVDEVNLQPKGRLSLYAQVGYRVNERVGLKLSYDGYAFDKSAEDVVYNLDGNYYAIHQPKSDMHTLTAAVSIAL
jgi:hypothetical protein